jgi:toxin ParE1/3/4
MPTLRKALRVERDLEVIWDYIAADNPEAAERCLRQIDSQFHKLARSPFIGRERKDLAAGLRSFAVGNYVIFYQPLVGSNGVEIVRVIPQPIMLTVQPVRVRRWKMTMKHLVKTDLGDWGDPAQASSVVKVLTGAGRANDQAVA